VSGGIDGTVVRGGGTLNTLVGLKENVEVREVRASVHAFGRGLDVIVVVQIRTGVLTKRNELGKYYKKMKQAENTDSKLLVLDGGHMNML